MTYKRGKMPPGADPWRRLAAAIVWHAAMTAQSDGPDAVEARAWLVSDPWGRYLTDALEIERARVLRAVAGMT